MSGSMPLGVLYTQSQVDSMLNNSAPETVTSQSPINPGSFGLDPTASATAQTPQYQTISGALKAHGLDANGYPINTQSSAQASTNPNINPYSVLNQDAQNMASGKTPVTGKSHVTGWFAQHLHDAGFILIGGTILVVAIIYALENSEVGKTATAATAAFV